MKYYLAPMEGITGYVYRNAYEKYFGGVCKYFAPFIVPNESKKTNTKEFKEILRENNSGINLVPQILTNSSRGFIDTANKIKSLGYDEVNLNLGCPAKTVVSKGKGSGFLGDVEGLDRFLDNVFNELDMKVSLKVRLGIHNEDEFYKLIKIYNKYPLEELIIHPRTREVFYGGKPNFEVFKDALRESTNKVIYNGDIFTKENYKEVISKFKDIDTFMIGRGILANPGLIGEIEEGKGLNKEILNSFLSEILENYLDVFKEERLVLYRMKELWGYLSYLIEDSEDYIRKIKRAETIKEYKMVVYEIFKNREVLKEGSCFKKW